MNIILRDSPLFLARTRVMRQNAAQRAAKVHHELPYSLSEFRQLVRSWLDRGGVGACVYCGCVLTEQSVSADHIVPLSRCINAQTFTLGNLACCCTRCNREKDRLTGAEYRELLGLLETWAPAARASVLGRLKAGAVKCAGKW